MNELVPKIRPTAPKSLKTNVINHIKKEKKMKSGNFKRYATAAAVLAAVAILPLVFSGGSESKAMTLLNESLVKVAELKTMVVKFLVRTQLQDNFDYIDIGGNFVEHTVSESFENPVIFRVEKPQRVAVFDGKKSLLWIKTSDEMFECEGIAGIFGELNEFLLNPKMLLENAQKAAKSKGAKIALKESENQITLTIVAKAQGNFSQNDYSKNSSINESDNRQVYVFDKATKLLQSLEISILNGRNYISVLKTENIEYNVPIDKNALMELPKDLVVKSMQVQKPASNLQTLTPKQAVEQLLAGFKNNDISQVEYMVQFYPVEKLKEMFFGLEILEIGEPFKSGLYVGYYVPIKVKLANGKTEKTNLAIRNDNEQQVWLLDGGI